MYLFIFKKIYSFLSIRKNYDPLFNSSGIIFFIQLVHFLLFMKIIGTYIPVFSKDYVANKLLFMPFGAIWLYLVYKYFNLKSKNLKIENVSLIQFVVILVVLIIIPLIILIQLSKK